MEEEKRKAELKKQEEEREKKRIEDLKRERELHQDKGKLEKERKMCTKLDEMAEVFVPSAVSAFSYRWLQQVEFLKRYDGTQGKCNLRVRQVELQVTNEHNVTRPTLVTSLDLQVTHRSIHLEEEAVHQAPHEREAGQRPTHPVLD